mgnify:CR=1 FL=1
MKPASNTPFLMVLASCLGLGAATAELPTIEDGPGMGSFASCDGKTFQLRVADDATVTVNPLKKNGEPTSYLRLRFNHSVRQVLPNGKLRPLEIDPTSLKSEHPATNELTETVITGIAGDGASFEIRVAIDKDVLSLGGRITDPGNETKFPLSFHFDTNLGHFRGRLLQRLDGDKKEFERIVGEDWFKLRHLDKKTVKHSLTDIYEESDLADLNGPGIREVEVQASIVDKNKRILLFEATGASSMRFSKRKGSGPYYEGYALDWSSDAGKDLNGDARLVFEIDEK